MWASRRRNTSARAPADAQLGIRVSKHVMVVIRSAHLLLQVASGAVGRPYQADRGLRKQFDGSNPVRSGFACQARRSSLALAFVSGFACQASRSSLALAFGDVT
jgi:hypothetical protein